MFTNSVSQATTQSTNSSSNFLLFKRPGDYFTNKNSIQPDAISTSINNSGMNVLQENFFGTNQNEFLILKTRPDFEGIGPFVGRTDSEWANPEIQKLHAILKKKHYSNFQSKTAWLDAGGGHDQIWGSEVKEYLLGGSGNDTIIGHGGDDFIDGGDGDDIIRLWDDDGAQTIVISKGKDKIEGFSHKEGDRISLRNITGTAYFTQVGDDTFVTGEGLDGITRLVNTKGSEVFASSIDSNSDLRAVNFKPTIDADGDGFVDGVSNYQIYNNDTPFDLTNKKGRTFSDTSTANWDAVKAVSSGSGYKVLLEGDAKRDGQHYVWNLNESGVITKGSGWKTTSDAVQLGWESTFGDINGDGTIGVNQLV